MKKNTIIILITIILSLFCSCDVKMSNNTLFYNFETNNYSIDVPSNWVKENGENTTYFYAEDSNFIMILTPEFNVDYYLPFSDELIDDFVEGVCSELEVVGKPQVERVTLKNRMRGFEVVVKCYANGKNYHLQDFVFFNEGYLNSVALACEYEKADDYVPIFKKTLETISIKNEVLPGDDKSTFSEQQIIEYLFRQGFDFQARESTSVYTTQYIYVSSEENEIAFQKIKNPILGNIYTWCNKDVNEEMAEIKKTYENDTLEKQRQYNEYEKWLDYHGLTSSQLTDALDYYHDTVTVYEKLPTTSEELAVYVKEQARY